MAKEDYYIKTRFQRSANIMADSHQEDFLDGYIVTQSACRIISDILAGISQGQGAFTLTGPYGGGKSSLCLFLMALLGDDKDTRKRALSKIPDDALFASVKKHIKNLKHAYVNIPITSWDASPVEILADTLGCKASPKAVLAKIEELHLEHGRINIFIDEMGKILEANHDPFFLQMLAELCNRSNGEINLVGCLHSAFSEYARGKAKHIADEWRKIQGRFLDISVNSLQEEQIILIGEAIGATSKSNKVYPVIKNFLKLKSSFSAKENTVEEKLLNSTYPLHPATVLLLTRYASSRISQSNRSIFTFLSSSERYGFLEYLKTENIEPDNLYTPDRFYDYIVENLRNSIVGTEVIGIFEAAKEALKEVSGNVVAEKVIKIIVLWQVFNPHNKIAMTSQSLDMIYPKLGIKKELISLEEAQLIRRDKKFGYIISETTDFDINKAKAEVLHEHTRHSLQSFREALHIRTVIGKEHLFKIGTIRSMDIVISHLDDIQGKEESSDKIGRFILILPRNADEENMAKKKIKENSGEKNNIYGLISDYEGICKIIQEIHVLKEINENDPNLHYNRVAKNIIESLIENENVELDQEIEKVLKKVFWYRQGKEIGVLGTKDYSKICSDIADDIFKKSPVINSELLNKNQLDSGATSGLRRLLNAMLSHKNKKRLGFEGYSTEATLYDIVLGNSRIHDASRSEVPYAIPSANHDPCKIKPIWEATTKMLNKKDDIIDLQDIYDVWSEPPFGVKDGLKPVLMLAYILAHDKNIARYINLENRYEFHTDLDDFFAETLLRRPQDIGLRFVSDEQKRGNLMDTLYAMAIREDSIPSPEQNEILDIAVSYKKFINGLPLCTRTTGNLNREARNFRNAIRDSEDPNEMINKGIKNACPVKKIPEVIAEIGNYYKKRIEAISEHIDKQLNITSKANGELKRRGKDVQHYATDPDVKMLSKYIEINDRIERAEKIIQMATGKLPEEWTDQVLNSSFIFITGHIDEFLRIERKIRLQNDEQVIVCIRDNGEYSEISASRKELKDFLDKRVGKNADNG